MGAVVGAAFGGALAVAGSSGPGIALKGEAIGLGMILELPMVIANIQRAGPSTGMPTKPEQSDLLQAFYGRNGESPLPIVAPSSPAECFSMAMEAMRLAVATSSPVMYLSDGYLANSSEPWRIPDIDRLPSIEISHPVANDDEEFLPYRRDPESLARPWAIPGIPGLEHRIGGLEKAEDSGNVSYDSENHERMTYLRAEKVQRLENIIPEQSVYGLSRGKLLVLGWGSTYGAIRSAVEQLQRKGLPVSHAHVRYLNPFPRNLGSILENFQTILVPEMNSGQLSLLIQGKFIREVVSFSNMQGRPFSILEIHEKIEALIG